MIRRLLLLAAIFVTLTALPGLAHEGEDHPTPAPTSSGTVQFPSDAQPPGRRNPWVAAVAATTIVLAGASGIYIYRLIKKGI